MRRTVAELGRLIGESPGLVAVRRRVEQLLRRQSGSRRLPPVLILGETGTGKGLLANAIHDTGPRAAGPFVAVNCAAIPETLLEAELFGFEQGAFTDARHAKAGLFQAANHGTLFLDEIGLLPPSLQAKLLTVLEDRTVRRLGSTRSEPVDVWIISATSENLRAGARRRGFREELYHRLAVVTLQLPALRERGQDILILAEHYLTRTCTDYGLPPKTLTEDARAALLAYRWPGNVRELANLMERVALLTDTRRLTTEVLELDAPRGRPPSRPPDDDARPSRGANATSLEHAVGEVERTRIVEALRETHGNISRAADRLGITRNILRYRLKKYGLQVQSETVDATVSAESVNPMAAVEPPPTPRTIHVQWERRHVALLRADLVTTAPVIVGRATGAALEALVEKIESFGGRVEEVSPRGLVAVFGLEPVEDAPRRAAYAALAIQKIVVPDRGGSAELLGIRLGLHAGEVWVAQVRGATRLDYEAKREVWQQLQAVMANASTETVLVSDATRPFLTRRFVLTAFEGTKERAYRLEGLERTGLGLGEQLTPFVGRGRALEQFAQALEQARAGHGQVIGVVGEAGVGKSRLVWEFINSDRVRDSLVLVSSAASYGKGMPYLPVIGLLKTYFKIEPRDDVDTVRRRVTEKVLSLEQRLAPTLSALLALLDMPVDDAQWQALDPPQKRQRTLEAVKLLLLEESRLWPVVVVFEDLHWVDAETQAVLDILVESLPGHRILLLTSYRPDHQHTWGSKTYYAQLRVDPLSPEDALALLDRLAGRDDAVAALKTVLIGRVGGNPFFLEESIQTLVETGALSGERGAYRPMQAMHTMQVPATVQAVLAARIDRLAPEAKALLQAAAVVGKDVPFELLHTVADMDDGGLRRALAQLQSSEFLYEVRLFPDVEYTFKHALTHEVAYTGVLHDRQRTLHARIAAAIEALHGDRLAEHVESIGHHAFRGEDWGKAAKFMREAGAKALARSANREATASFQHALEALTRLPHDNDTTELAIDLRLDLYNALVPLDELRSLLGYLREAEALAIALGDRRRLGLTRLHMSHVLILIDDTRASVQVAHYAAAIGEDLGDEAIASRAHQWLGCSCYALGEHHAAVEWLRKSNTWAPRDDPRFVSRPRHSGYLAMFLAELGEFVEAELAAKVTFQLTTPERPWNFANACWQIAWFWCLKGDMDRATPLAERAVAFQREWGFRRTLGTSASLLGHILALSGRVPEAIDLLEQGVREAETFGATWLRCPRLQFLGEAYLLAGRLEQAKQTADQGLSLARERGERGFEAWALRLQAEIAGAAHPTDAPGADARYREAMALAEELEMRPLLAHCHFGLGKLYRFTGKRDEGREHLATATRMYREMDMRFWLEQVTHVTDSEDSS
jgi:DNA-binding NtrC family response regulator/tetratricopeptide (TPR) repeat protein